MAVQARCTSSIVIQLLSGSQVTIPVESSMQLGDLRDRMAALLNVPCERQRLLLDGLAVTSNRTTTLHAAGIDAESCLTVVVMTPFRWLRLGGGTVLEEDSGGSRWCKTKALPDYSAAIAGPGFSEGEHCWQLHLRGNKSRCFVGVCGSLEDSDLDDFPLNLAWQVHFTSRENGTLGVLYINGVDEEGWRGKAEPKYNHEEGLLIHVRVNVEMGILTVNFSSADGVEHEIEVPRPDFLMPGCELFPYTALDDEDHSFEIK